MDLVVGKAFGGTSDSPTVPRYYGLSKIFTKI